MEHPDSDKYFKIYPTLIRKKGAMINCWFCFRLPLFGVLHMKMTKNAKVTIFILCVGETQLSLAKRTFLLAD